MCLNFHFFFFTFFYSIFFSISNYIKAIIFKFVKINTNAMCLYSMEISSSNIELSVFFFFFLFLAKNQMIHFNLLSFIVVHLKIYSEFLIHLLYSFVSNISNISISFPIILSACHKNFAMVTPSIILVLKNEFLT